MLDIIGENPPVSESAIHVWLWRKRLVRRLDSDSYAAVSA